MSEPITKRATVLFPSTITVPDDSESLLWSGPVKTTVRDLVDRADYLRDATSLACVRGTNATAGTSTWTSIAGSSSTIPLGIGDRVHILAGVEGSNPIGSVMVRIAATAGGVTEYPGMAFGGTSVVYNSRFIVGLFIASRAGEHVFSIQQMNPSASDRVSKYQMLLEVYRR